jgi:lipopolysaccharide export system protein LptA
MMSGRIWRRATSVTVAVTVAGLAGSAGARQARAQAKPMRIGTVRASADSSEVGLTGKTIVLTGSVTIQTSDGQSAAADTMRLSMGSNPVTRKDDVATVTAEGHVRFKVVQSVIEKGSSPMKRVIEGTSDKIVWHRADNRAELTGHVTVSSDDPARSMTWLNVGTAIIDMSDGGSVKTQKAAAGPQIAIEVVSKEPLTKKAETKTK